MKISLINVIDFYQQFDPFMKVTRLAYTKSICSKEISISKTIENEAQKKISMNNNIRKRSKKNCEPFKAG